MLKQLAFFDKLKKKGLTPKDYHILVRLYGKPNLSDLGKEIIKKNSALIPYINDDVSLKESTIKMIEDIDLLFKPIKKIKNLQLLGPDSDKHIDEFINLFPTHKLPNGKYARGNKKNIQENFMWFFQEYNYDWETILQATRRYIDEYQRNNYQYMRTAMYFIKKVIDGTAVSELANYCDMVNSSADYVPERYIKTRVV